jgi:hypothetical protein
MSTPGYLRPNGKVAREEKRTYTVTPKAKGFERKLEKFEGWYERKGQMIPYSEPGYNYKGMDIDGDLIDDLIDDWTGNEESKDGVDKDFFPLTSKLPEEVHVLRPPVRYQLAFAPREKNSAPWKGDIAVDPETLHPRTMNSTLVYRLPAAAKIIFVNVAHQVGYSVNYGKVI